jgi:phosphate transport system substrate-binding protein
MRWYGKIGVLFLIGVFCLTIAPQTMATPPQTPALADFTPRDIDVDIQGSGATMPEPLYKQLIIDYDSVAGKVDMTYTGTGSSHGMESFVNGGHEFAGTDIVLESSLLDDNKHRYVPIVLSPVVITYNAESLELDSPHPLKFSGKTLVGIFDGKITNWNDEAIANDNPRHTLPDRPITIVYRSNGAGTSSVLTTFLDKIAPDTFEPTAEFTPDVAEKIGKETDEDVATTIGNRDGAIGYVTYYYAKEEQLPLSRIQNRTSKLWIKPSLMTTTSASLDAAYPDNPRVAIVDSSKEYAYPLAAFTWILVKERDYEDLNQAQAVTDFLYWMVQEPQQMKARKYGYAPLTDEARALATEQLEKVMVNDEQAFTRP